MGKCITCGKECVRNRCRECYFKKGTPVSKLRRKEQDGK